MSAKRGTLALMAALWGIACLLPACRGECSSGSATEWVPIPPGQYDRNFSSIAEQGRRPLGFASEVLLYNVPDSQPPCISVDTGSEGAGQQLEVAFQTQPPARLCFRHQGMAEPECAMGSLRTCIPAPSSKAFVEFVCDSSCETQDVNFWYRFEVSPVGADGELWCMDRSPDEFPLSLLALPPGQSFSVMVNDGPVGGTSPVSGSPVLLLLLPLLVHTVFA